MDQSKIQLIIMTITLIALLIYLMVMIGLMSSQAQVHINSVEDVNELRTAVKTKYNIV
jgi:hypothetical protein